MKKTIFKLIPLLLSSALVFGGCSAPSTKTSASSSPSLSTAPTKTAMPVPSTSGEKLKINVGATAVPHAEILNFIKEDLLAKGVELTVTEFGDYALLNPNLNDKQIDANFFQHTPYLEDYVKNSKQDLVEVVKVHIEPLGVYSKKVKSLEEIADKSIVGIPNDSTNEARALLLLESIGLIKLKEGMGFSATPNDVIENPKNLVFKELEAAVLPRTLDETTISIINTNYALEAGLNPTKDAIASEDKNSPYANILVVKSENKNDAAVKLLAEALTSDKVRDFINQKYGGSIVPSF